MNQPSAPPAAPDRVRLVFMGTPEFAAPTLLRLLAIPTLDVAAVFTQPDRPAGRGRRVQPSPVKAIALDHQILVNQPISLRRDRAAVDVLRALAPDVVVVAAYGLILPPAVLAIPRCGTLNVHASLLPRWRGAAPVNHAILAGDVQTGVTIMLVEAGLDTGPMLARRTTEIASDESAATLTERLAEMGADLLAETLPQWLAGSIFPEPQDEALATYAPRLERRQGKLDWADPAPLVVRQVRAFQPWPGTFADWNGDVLKVLSATALGPDQARLNDGDTSTGIGIDAANDGTSGNLAGIVAVADNSSGTPAVLTGNGWLRLDLIQAPGSRPMSGADFARGRPGFIGSRLT